MSEALSLMFAAGGIAIVILAGLMAWVKWRNRD